MQMPFDPFVLALGVGLCVLFLSALAESTPLWEGIDPARVPDIWPHLANESVMYPLDMRAIAMRIGPEHQLFLDNCLIAETSHVGREVHQPRREPLPVLSAPAGKSLQAFVLHVLQFEEPPRFRMWYWSWKQWHEWRQGEDIRFATSYAVSEDGLRWERPELDLYHIEGSPERNIILPYGMMHGMFYEPLEPDPERRFKALVCIEAKSKADGRFTIPEGYYLHWSSDGIHWKGDLSHYVLPSLQGGYDYPQSGVGDTSRFWWDPYRKRYIGDVKFVLPGKLRCRGLMESDDLVHWTRARPTFFARRPDTQIYGHRGYPYEGMYVGLRWIYHPSLDPPHHQHVELDCSRDGVSWTRAGAGQRFMDMNPKNDTWDAAIVKPTAMLTVGDEICIYYTGLTLAARAPADPSRTGYQNSTGLARLRRDGFVSITADDEPGWLITRPLGFQGRELRLNAEVAPGGSIRVGVLRRDGEPIDGLRAEDCEPLTGDQIDASAQWEGGPDMRALSGSDVRLKFQLHNAKLYSFWIE